MGQTIAFAVETDKVPSCAAVFMLESCIIQAADC